MVNIWDFQDYPAVRVTTKDGKVFTGGVIALDDGEELDTDEDSIVIENERGWIARFFEDEIKSIERI